MEIRTVDKTEDTPKIEVLRRPSIKLATHPQIIIAIPCGEKNVHTVFTCPSDKGGCGSTWLAPGKRAPNLVPIHFLLAHMNLQPPLNVTMSYMVESGRLSAEARQVMTNQALKMEESKYILYWDDDVIPPAMGLYTLHNFMERNPTAGAVSGVYVTREDPCEPLIYKEHGTGAWWDFPMGETAKPQPIFGAGAGFLLARLEAIKDVTAKLGEVPIWADERTLAQDTTDNVERNIMWGHDIRFCKLLNEHDWPVYVDGRVICDHVDISTGTVYKMPPDAPGFSIAMEAQDAPSTE